MDLRTKLDILHDDGGVFADYSADAQDFKRDPFTITLTTDDYLYVGFKKTINALYASVQVVNTNASTMSLEYWNGTAWTVLEASDDTRGFTRSGFITWSRPDDDEAVTVDTKEACWMRMSVDADTTAVEFQALNIVFSDDNDISQEVPALVDACFYPANQTSHILIHVSAKNYIMGRLRSLGYVQSTADGEENINEWDVLDIYEIRMASTYYTISQIYFNLADDPEDQYWAKYKEYEQKFEEAFGLGRLRIDVNDDGKVAASEKRQIRTLRWGR
jgi:hypothetical protein